MATVASSHITSVHSEDGEVFRQETTGDSELFEQSQLIPGKDGSWLMLDWIGWENGDWSWYVTECV